MLWPIIMKTLTGVALASAVAEEMPRSRTKGVMSGLYTVGSVVG